MISFIESFVEVLRKPSTTISLHKMEVGEVARIKERPACVRMTAACTWRDLIDTDHFITTFQKTTHKVTADKTSAAGNKTSHRKYSPELHFAIADARANVWHYSIVALSIQSN